MLRADRLRLEAPGKLLCRELSVSLEAGQCWAVLGRNGCGKTTLLHALGNLARPASGTVSLDGRPLADIPQRQLAGRIGILLQDDQSAFSGTVLDFVLLGCFPHGGTPRHELEAARRALSSTGMAHAERQACATLSGGERQRVRIAQLLAQAPQVYLLDEPLQHLDLPHQLAAMRLFRKLGQTAGKTVVAVLHDMFWAARYCDRAILIYDGGETRSGETAALSTSENMESLYQCRLQRIETKDGNYFLPTLE